MAVACGSPGDLEFDEHGQIQLTCIAYLLYPDQALSAETGEVSEVCRTCLISADGRVWRTTSQATPHALHRLLQLYTEEEWLAGIKLAIMERRSRKTGRTYHDLRVVVDPADAPARGTTHESQTQPGT